MEQKKFMDISRIKEDTELTVANTGGFHVVFQPLKALKIWHFRG